MDVVDEPVARRELDRLPAQAQVGPSINVAAARQAELTGAQAHRQDGNVASERRREELTFGGQGRLTLVVDHARLADRDQGGQAVELAGSGQRVTPVEAPDVEIEPRLTQVIADQRRRPQGVVLHDDDGSHWSHSFRAHKGGCRPDRSGRVYDTPVGMSLPARRASPS